MNNQSQTPGDGKQLLTKQTLRELGLLVAGFLLQAIYEWFKIILNLPLEQAVELTVFTLMMLGGITLILLLFRKP